MAMSAEDWQKFTDILREHRSDLKEDVQLICQQKCSEAIAKHESGAWSHNPKKAFGLGAAILALVEGARKFFGH